MLTLGKLFRRPASTEPVETITSSHGHTEWLRNGLPHRDDGPAIRYKDGSEVWYRNGLCHRDDGPAVEWTNGTREWFRNGQRHREDGPAIEYVDGTKEWWLQGKRLTVNETALHQSTALGSIAPSMPAEVVSTLPYQKPVRLNL